MRLRRIRGLHRQAARTYQNMQALRLISIDDELMRIVADGTKCFTARYAASLGECGPTVRDVVSQTRSLYERKPRVEPWIGYLAVDRGDAVVGTCGFTGAPASDGAVEIAYFTLRPFERRGYGTAMAAGLIEIADRSGLVVRVIAHTLPEANASTRILQRVGMTCAGEIEHPEDGRVWLWELRPGAAKDT